MWPTQKSGSMSNTRCRRWRASSRLPAANSGPLSSVSRMIESGSNSRAMRSCSIASASRPSVSSSCEWPKWALLSLGFSNVACLNAASAPGQSQSCQKRFQPMLACASARSGAISTARCAWRLASANVCIGSPSAPKIMRRFDSAMPT